MASYRRNADANRDALFGPNPGGSKPAARKKPAASTSRPAPSESTTIPSTTTTTRMTGARRTNNFVRSLQGQAKIEKMKEAEEYRKKAKKSLQRTLFSSPDPIAGAMFYHRAAEAYKLCGENRLERLHRIASGDCQMGHDAYASAAGEYVRAAELAEMSDETDDRKRAECTKLYSDAAKAWREEGEMGRTGECMLRSGFSLLIGGGGEDDLIDGRRLTKMGKDALTVIEGAVESHVPDPLNRYKHYRQTGISSFIDPDAEEDGHEQGVDDATLEMCRNHVVKSSFAHETLTQAIRKFVEYGEFKSALYTSGAVSALLESDGFSTITLSRAFCAETVLTLALGDVVAADKFFLEVHLQNSNYLQSRECKLAEDLIRAVKMRSTDDLEIARDQSGENRAAMANLDSSLRNVVATLRISGAVKTKTKNIQNASAPSPAPPVPVPIPAQAPINVPMPAPALENNATVQPPPPSSLGGEKLQNELDDLMNDMGLESDEEEDDDEIDLT